MPDPTPLAQPGGITYGAAKTTLARVVDNGVCDSDTRVLERTNEATKLLLDAIIPVGGMATYDVIATGTKLLLPPQLENVIEQEVLGSGLVNNESDVRQGWYDLVNNFTYVDPSMQQDSPLVDEFLHPDPTDPTVLRRQYDFPGVTQGATVRVTGAKRFMPISSDNDYLIIQNLRAMKLAIQALERWDINDRDNGKGYFEDAVAILKAEVTKHLLDPRNSLKRRANYERDMGTYPVNSFGWVRAMLALEIPGLLSRGKSDITRFLEMAEMRLIGKGVWKGTLEMFRAEVVGGKVQFPLRVESLLAADLCGLPIDIRSIFFPFLKNGPGMASACACNAILIDDGDVYDATAETTRRQYRLTIPETSTECLTVVAKLRWVKKELGEQMIIKNTEALRLMIQGIMAEEAEKWQDGAASVAFALNELEKELREYLGGQQNVPHVDMEPIGGEVL